MDISFVILTWNSERYIERCFNSILVDLHKTQYSYEIFIVDNGSRDRTVSILKSLQAKYPEHIFPIYLDKNTGTTYSRNLALKQAQGNYVCIVDSDIEISIGVIARLIDILEENEKVGLAAPKLVYPNGRLQKSTDVFPTIITKLLRYFFLKTVEKRENKLGTWISPQQKGLREVDYAISAVWMLKKEVFGQVGFLDENIFYAPEDVDYCLRTWKTGYKVVYAPDVSCVHYSQEISRGLKINVATLNHICGLLYYFRKHRYIFTRPKIRQGYKM